MTSRQLFGGALLLLVSMGATACGEPDGSSTGLPSGTGAGGTGGSGGNGGLEPLPDLDPAACPVTADSGEEPALSDAAEAQWSADYVAPESGSIQQDKAFFLATLLRADTALLADLAADPTLDAIRQDRDDR
ncbi:MAG TPA: hypothetical protein VK459_28345, partial [Polyangiaceae bacterium]|nr:hypothetical protein [Polyangiaceae bacterium]